jgi:hypothetical protein
MAFISSGETGLNKHHFIVTEDTYYTKLTQTGAKVQQLLN